MANKKFSDFTNQDSTANTFVVGYDGSTNVRLSPTDSLFQGHEPFKRETFVAPLQIGNQFNGDQYTYKTFTSNLDNYAVPFMFQQNITLNAFRVYNQSGSPTGRFGVYKYNGTNVGIDAQFALEYEEPTSTLAAGLNTINISSPFTFTAGEVYFVIFIPTTSASLYCMLQSGNNANYRWHTSKFFGNLRNYQKYSGGIISNLQLTGSGNALLQ